MAEAKARKSKEELEAMTAVQDPNLMENTGDMVPSVKSAMSIGHSAGEVDDSDLKIPYLSIAYGVGKLSVEFNPGDLVLGGEHLLVKKKEPLTIVILSDVKYYKENLSQEAWANGQRPRTLMTKHDVLAAGGTLEWATDPDTGQRVRPTFGPALDMKILIEKPESLDDAQFGIEVEGKRYTPAYFSVDKSAYNRVGKTIQTNKSLSLSAVGILGGVWELHTESQEINGNPTVVPVIRLASLTTDTFRQEILSLFNS